MNYALVNNQTNIVENIIVLEEGAEWAPPSGMSIVPLISQFGIGDTWDGTSFTRQPMPEPVNDSAAGQNISTGTQSL